MLVKVLGAAAGGAFPQWNCACQQCERLRTGTFAGQSRTQAQVAVSENGVAWTLLNASPDLRNQVEATPELWPRGGSLNSPIHSIVLPRPRPTPSPAYFRCASFSCSTFTPRAPCCE